MNVANGIEDVIDAVRSEVYRARTIHPEMNSLHEGYAVIKEEFEEFWDLAKVNPKKLTPEDQAKREHDLKLELVQTAAMCIRTIIDCGLNGR